MTSTYDMNSPISLVIDGVLRYRVRRGAVIVKLDDANGVVMTIREPAPLGCAVFCLPRDGEAAMILPSFQKGWKSE